MLGLTLHLTACAHTTPAPQRDPECSTAELDQTLTSAPTAQVIMLLQPDAQRARLLQDLGEDFQVARSYTSIAGVAGTITRKGYERAQAHRAVRCIQLDHPGSGGG